MSNAARLHREALVVDTMGPPGPSIHTGRMLAQLDELGDTDPALAIDAMELAADRELLDGTLDGFWEGWQRSGVDVSSVTIGAFGARPFSYDNAIRDIARWTRKFDALDGFVKVTGAADAERAHAEGRVGVILNFQNTTHFGDDLEVLERFHALGVRIVQLTYNGRNLVGDGCTERNPGGLSLFGQQVVRRMNELGILIDVSHCSRATALDAVEASRHPIAITHGFARALNDHDRGADDDVIRAVAAGGGYIGIVCVPFFLSTEPEVCLEHLMRHVDHVAGLVGIEHTGIGTDWAPPVPERLQAMLTRGVAEIGFRPEHRVDWGATITELADYTDWPRITGALLAHGLREEEITGVLGRNFLRVFAEVVG